MKKNECKEKIISSLSERIKEIKELLKRVEEGSDIYEELDNYALAYDDDYHYRAKRLELSWGGPSDGFLFFTNEETIRYYYANWWCYEEIELTGEDYTVLQDFYERIEV